MKERYIPALIMLIAGAVTSILDIIHKVELLTSLKRLLLVLILFYIIGLIAKAVIKRATMTKDKKEEVEEPNEEEAAKDDKADSEKGKV
jgi:Ca2+/H+ antiporter